MAVAVGGCTSIEGSRSAATYVGTLPCADCAGVKTVLTLWRDETGTPAHYRLRATYLGTVDGDRTLDSRGAWVEAAADSAGPARVRLDPQDDAAHRSFARAADKLRLLDRNEQPIASGHPLELVRDDRAALPRVDMSRVLFAGTLTRQGAHWQLTRCGQRSAQPARDVSPEAMLAAVLTDLGFDRSGAMYLEAFGREAEGVLHLERLNRAGTELRCATPAAAGEALQWQALGHEPSWSLRATPSALILDSPGSTRRRPPVALRWHWRDGRADRAQAILAVHTEAVRLALTLTPGVCRDTMADIAYGFRADLTLDPPAAGPRRGCAYLGSELLP